MLNAAQNRRVDRLCERRIGVGRGGHATDAKPIWLTENYDSTLKSAQAKPRRATRAGHSRSMRSANEAPLSLAARNGGSRRSSIVTRRRATSAPTMRSSRGLATLPHGEIIALHRPGVE